MRLFDTMRRWLAGKDTSVLATTTLGADGPQLSPNGSKDAVAPYFPYPIVTVNGRDALTTWNRIRVEGEGWPVILGNDDDVIMIREGIEDIDDRSPEDILAAAAQLSFPDSLVAKRREDDQRAREWLRDQGHDDDDETPEPAVGDWPDSVVPIGLTIASDVLTGRPFDRVHIVTLPCKAGWEAIAFLRWGGWNDNPAAEYHVAALKRWHEAFGAELVGCSHDVINVHVAARPASREAALALAHEQYLYCADIVDQGTETMSGLAATLMADDWWYFWWD